MGLLTRVENPLFSSAGFKVPKKTGSYILVVDIRRVDEVSELTATKLANLRNSMSWTPQGSRYFGGLDAL